MNNQTHISLLESINSVVLGENQKELSRKEMLDLKHGSVGPGADQNNELLDYQKQTGSNSSPDNPRHPAFKHPHDRKVVPPAARKSQKRREDTHDRNKTQQHAARRDDAHLDDEADQPRIHVGAVGPPAPYEQEIIFEPRSSNDHHSIGVTPITQRSRSEYVTDPQRGPMIMPGMNTTSTVRFNRPKHIPKSAQWDNDQFYNPGVYPTTTKRPSEITDQDVVLTHPGHGLYGSNRPGTAIPYSGKQFKQNYRRGQEYPH